MSITASNFPMPYSSLNGINDWRNRSSMKVMKPSLDATSYGNVDDGLTSLSWLQNLNMCMTRLGAPTPPTPPASPIYSMNTSLSSRTGKSTLSSPSSLSQDKSMTKSDSSAQNSQKSSRKKEKINSKKPQKKEEEKIDYKTNGSVKPPYSYATLICMAMKANKNKMTLSAIYKWIRESFLYYKNVDPSWQNSIRHNLSLNKCFIKIARSKDEPGKGGFWRLDPDYANTLVDGVFKKRRTGQRRRRSKGQNKKCRKKEDSNESNISTNMEMSCMPNGMTSYVLHDTPPGSEESYNAYGEHVNDIVEISTAVNSIETVGQCSHSYSYAMQPLQEHHLITHPGYSDEVCITTSSACMLEADGNDICWNAILTDADLGGLVDGTSYAGHEVNTVVHSSEESSPTASADTVTTAQLTAVEPHTLHLLASEENNNAGSNSNHHNSNNNVLEETQMFHANSNKSISAINSHSIPLQIAANDDIISATHNVVTCVNPTSVNPNHWSNHWSSYPVVSSQHGTNDLMIRHIGVNGQVISNMINPLTITYVTNTVSAQAYQQSNSKNDPNVTLPAQSVSPNSTNFEHHHQSHIQPWEECKVALEAAALDLDNFGDIDHTTGGY